MNIIGNKTIMEYMGIKPRMESPDIYSLSDTPFFTTRTSTPEEAIENYANYAKYDTSWDWLKPVIDKIIKEIGVKSVDECTDDEWIYYTAITRMYIGVSIDIAYNYVVDYLLWYNKNKK